MRSNPPQSYFMGKQKENNMPIDKENMPERCIHKTKQKYKTLSAIISE